MSSRICTINARGGSKGFPGKNSKILDGLPLISHTIRHAKQSRLFSLILVSSDSSELLDIARDEGVATVERPASLASDTAPKVPAIIHAVQHGELQFGGTFDTVVDLDVTSPLRLPEDVIEAVRILEHNRLKSVFSVCESHRSPYFNLVAMDANREWGPAIRTPLPFSRRQDAPKTFDMNASIYAWRRDSLLQEKTVFTDSSEAFVMPLERSWDIDTELDFDIVKFFYERRQK